MQQPQSEKVLQTYENQTCVLATKTLFLVLILSPASKHASTHELFTTLLDEHDGDFRNSNAKITNPHQGKLIILNKRISHGP